VTRDSTKLLSKMYDNEDEEHEIYQLEDSTTILPSNQTTKEDWGNVSCNDY